METISVEQTTENQLQKHLKGENKNDFTKREFMGHEVILQKGKIYLPRSLRRQVLDWYHWYLCHFGETRM